jgi:hypothetical protein
MAAAAVVDPRIAAQAGIQEALDAVYGGQNILQRTLAAVAVAANNAGNYSERIQRIADIVFDAAAAAGLPADDLVHRRYKFLAALCATGNDRAGEHIIKIIGDLLHDIKVQGYVHPIPIGGGVAGNQSIENFARTLIPVGVEQGPIINTLNRFKQRESNIHDHFRTYGFTPPFKIVSNNNIQAEIAEYLAGLNYRYILMDSQFGNIFKRSAFAGFTSIDATVSRVDGATKVGPVILTNNGVNYVSHPENFTIAFFYNGFRHKMYATDDEVRIEIMFPDDGGRIVVTCATGLSVNAVAEAAGIPPPRGSGKAGTEVKIVEPTEAAVAAGTDPRHWRHQVMLIKTITDWAQIVYCCWLNSIRIPTVFVTNDEFCCELAAILRLPFVLRTPSTVSTEVHLHKYVDDRLTDEDITNIIRGLSWFRNIDGAVAAAGADPAAVAAVFKNKVEGILTLAGYDFALEAGGEAGNIIKTCIDTDIERLRGDIITEFTRLHTGWGNLRLLLGQLGIGDAEANLPTIPNTLRQRLVAIAQAASAAAPAAAAAAANPDLVLITVAQYTSTAVSAWAAVAAQAQAAAVAQAQATGAAILNAIQIFERYRLLIPVAQNIGPYIVNLYKEGIGRIFHKYHTFYKELKYQYIQTIALDRYNDATTAMVNIIYSLLQSLGLDNGIRLDAAAAAAAGGIDGNEYFKNILRLFSFREKNGSAQLAITTFHTKVPSFGPVAGAVRNSRADGYILGKVDKFNFVMDECLFPIKQAVEAIVPPAAVAPVINEIIPVAEAVAVAVNAAVVAAGNPAVANATADATIAGQIGGFAEARRALLVAEPATVAAAVPAADLDDDDDVAPGAVAAPEDVDPHEVIAGTSETAIKSTIKKAAIANYNIRIRGVAPGENAEQLTERARRAAKRAAIQVASGPKLRRKIPNIPAVELDPPVAVPVGVQGGGAYDSQIPNDDWYGVPLFIHEITADDIQDINENKRIFTQQIDYRAGRQKKSINTASLDAATTYFINRIPEMFSNSIADESLPTAISLFGIHLLNILDELEADANESGLYGLWDEALRDIEIMAREINRGAASRLSIVEYIQQLGWFMYASRVTSNIFLNVVHPEFVKKIAIVHWILESRATAAVDYGNAYIAALHPYGILNEVSVLVQNIRPEGITHPIIAALNILYLSTHLENLVNPDIRAAAIESNGRIEVAPVLAGMPGMPEARSSVVLRLQQLQQLRQQEEYEEYQRDQSAAAARFVPPFGGFGAPVADAGGQGGAAETPKEKAKKASQTARLKAVGPIREKYLSKIGKESGKYAAHAAEYKLGMYPPESGQKLRDIGGRAYLQALREAAINRRRTHNAGAGATQVATFGGGARRVTRSRRHLRRTRRRAAERSRRKMTRRRR